VTLATAVIGGPSIGSFGPTGLLVGVDVQPDRHGVVIGSRNGFAKGVCVDDRDRRRNRPGYRKAGFQPGGS
jgi:hypothetical protein